MPLEKTLRNNINIKNLAIEQPQRKEDYFDAKKEVSNEDWDSMKKVLEYYYESNHDSDFFEIAEDMKIIFPERESELNLDDVMWNEMARGLRNTGGYSIVRKARVLFPERLKSVYSLDDGDWGEIKHWCLEFDELYSGNFEDFIKKVRFAFYLFPERIMELDLENTMWDDAKKIIEEYRTKDIEKFVYYLAQAKLIFPNKVKRSTVEPEIWSLGREKLQNHRLGNKWKSFAALAATMKILAAEQIQITDKGLEVLMPKSKKDFKTKTTESLPQTKKF